MNEKLFRPTVALVAHDIHDHGGMERVFAELIRRLSGDYRIIVVSATLDESLRPLVDWRRVPTPTKPFPVKFAWFFVVGALRLRRVESDLIHVLGAIIPTRADTVCIAFCHAAFALTSRGLLSPDGSMLRRSNSRISRWMALRAERWCFRPGRVRSFGAVSAGVARELRQHYPGIPVSLTPNGVDVGRYCPDALMRKRLRDVEGVRGDEIVILFVGGDWERKGLRVAIRALSIARRGGMPGVLWVVGSGEVGRFRALAQEVGMHDFVRFFGRRPTTEFYFQAADIFLLPTLYETFSLVAYEAAASGLPIVATAANGVDELLLGGVGGILVERNTDEIAEALMTLWRNLPLRDSLGASGRKRASEYSWDRAANSVRELYEGLLLQQDHDPVRF